MASTRLKDTFAKLKSEGRSGLVTYIMGGDPDIGTTARLLEGLPEAGADVIELGMPFSDPMADGPAIQKAGLRALRAGTKIRDVLSTVKSFRETNAETPVVLMGYFNPIFSYGAERFVEDALASGVDGLIIVDLPPEEDGELCIPCVKAGLPFIRLATPTTDEHRLEAVLRNTSGFLYYVSITGITGGAAPDPNDLKPHLNLIRKHTDLPLAVGFGIRDAESVRRITEIADAAVVGTAIVSRIASHEGGPDLIEDVLGFVRELASGKTQRS